MKTPSSMLRRIGIIGVLATALVTLIPSAAGASSGCGEYSFGFAGTRLLNDGISDSAGPFSIDLPAGTWDVTLVSHDNHSSHDQPEQTEEQWYVQLGDVWTSPLTRDLPDDLDTITSTFMNQTIGAATEISVHHRGVGTVNSVDVVCVGFTASAPPAEPDAEIAPPVNPIIPDQPLPVNEPAEEPNAEIAPPVGPIIPPAQIIDPKPDIEIAGPGVGILPPVSPDEPVVEPEVMGAIETPAPQLALTGPNDVVAGLVVLGVSMIALGVALVSRERSLRGSLES